MTGPGRLIAVVGPSGVGKDSVMTALAAAVPGLGCVRRVITRAAEAGGEDFTPSDDATFERLRAEGAFALHWGAHGLRYGIPHRELLPLDQGRDLLVNLSRGVLAEAAQRVPRLVVLHLTATPETLAQRLAARGREEGDTLTRRLARTGAAIPADLPGISVANDGALDDTVAAIRAQLFPDNGRV